MLVKYKVIGIIKKVKACLQNKISDATFKARPFSLNFNFLCKDGWITAATCKYDCPLVVDPTITNCFKELHLKQGRIPRSVFENVTIHENESGFMWKPVFFLIILKFCHLYWKSLCLSLLLFTVWWSIFEQPCRWLLPLSSFYGPSQWLFKVKLLVKE